MFERFAQLAVGEVSDSATTEDDDIQAAEALRPMSEAVPDDPFDAVAVNSPARDFARDRQAEAGIVQIVARAQNRQSGVAGLQPTLEDALVFGRPGQSRAPGKALR